MAKPKRKAAEGGRPLCLLDEAEAHGIERVLGKDGTPDGTIPDPELDEATLRRLYETMVLVRAVDERGFKLQRSGRIKFWIPGRGLEGTHVAATMIYAPDDWVFMGYRHPGCMLLRGVPLQRLFYQFFGRVGEPMKGRRLPNIMGDRAANIPPMMTQVGSYIPHAAGAAWAAKLQGHDTRFLTLFGDGATSRGEFHSAMNFSGIHKPPIVFICENNGWAISTPNDAQTASRTFSEKGDAYAIPNRRIDGNDPLAVYAAVKAAYDRLHEEGPMLIEAVTYRMGLHTTSDDPNLYREQSQVDAWAEWDPLVRTRKYLEHRGFWTQEQEDALQARCLEEIAECVTRAEAAPLPDPASMFDDTYAELGWQLEEQKARLLAELEEMR